MTDTLNTPDTPTDNTPARPADRRPIDPLHGVKLEQILTELVDHFGWQTMAERIHIRCFTTNPSIGSSLHFLRRTPWAREKVEEMYRFLLRERARQARRGTA